MTVTVADDFVAVPPDMVVLDGYRSGDVVEVRSGKSVDISCRATGAKPASEMVWYRSENGRSMPIPGTCHRRKSRKLANFSFHKF